MRELTVSRKFQKGKTDPLNKHKLTEVPFINLAGKYLKNAGFNVGDTVEIEILEDCLVITKPTPNYLKMLAKNPHLEELKKLLNLIEIL